MLGVIQTRTILALWVALRHCLGHPVVMTFTTDCHDPTGGLSRGMRWERRPVRTTVCAYPHAVADLYGAPAPRRESGRTRGSDRWPCRRQPIRLHERTGDPGVRKIGRAHV